MSAPKHQMSNISKLQLLPERITRNAMVIPFFDERSLHAFILTCSPYYDRYKNAYTDKKNALEMLNCVLNPNFLNNSRFQELLSQPKQDLNGLPLYLIPNTGKESIIFRGPKINIKIHHLSVNVLEAILGTGNFPLAKILFNSIPETEKTSTLKALIKNIRAKGFMGMSEAQIVYKKWINSWNELFAYDCFDSARTEFEKLCAPIGAEAVNINFEVTAVNMIARGYNTEYEPCICKVSHVFRFGDRVVNLLVTAVRNDKKAFEEDSKAFEKQDNELSLGLDKTIKQYGLAEIPNTSESAALFQFKPGSNTVFDEIPQDHDEQLRDYDGQPKKKKARYA